MQSSNCVIRYEIGVGSADWADAERQIKKAAEKGGSNSMTVAVKTGKEKKRKAGDALEEAHKEAEKFKDGGKKKKTSKSGKAR